MKVLFTVNGYPPREAAGTELYARDLAAAISGDARLTVFCRTVDRSLPEHSLVRDVVEDSRVVRMVNNLAGALDPERYYKDPKADAIFKGLLDESRPDIVHIHHLMGLSGGMIAAAKDAGIPVVVTLHDYWFICPRWQLVDEGGSPCRGPEGGSKCPVACPNSMFAVGGAMGGMARVLMGFIPSGIQRRLKQAVRDGRFRDGRDDAGKFISRAGYLRDMLSLADAMVAPSNFVRDIFIENGFNAEKIQVIPHGIALPECMPVTRSEKVRFGYIGSFAPLKGVEMLVEAFSKLGPGAELHIHGHGGENHEIIAGRLTERAAGKAVFFHGRYEREALGGLLAGLDVVVVPSLWPETFGIVVREAFSCGVPVICSDAGALAEAVRDGIDGLLFRCGDAEDLSAKMCKIMDDPEMLKRLSQNISPVKPIEVHGREIMALYAKVRDRFREA